VRSKADEMANLIYRRAQKRKNKGKIKTKTEQLRRNGPGKSVKAVRDSGDWDVIFHILIVELKIDQTILL